MTHLISDIHPEFYLIKPGKFIYKKILTGKIIDDKNQ
jgi:hypothetical protein